MDVGKKSIGVLVDGTLQQIYWRVKVVRKVADVDTENVKHWNGFPSTQSIPVITNVT